MTGTRSTDRPEEHLTTRTGTGAVPRAAARWPDRVGWWAGAWAGAYGVLALAWTVTGAGYPYEAGDGMASLLGGVPAGLGAPVLAGVLLATAVLCLATAGRHGVRVPGPARAVLLAAGWTVAAALLVVVPDATVLALTAYAPMLVLGAPFGWPPVDYSEVLTWALANKIVCMAGGVLVSGAVLTWQRRSRGACAACGRSSSRTRSVVPGCPGGRRPVQRWAWYAVAVAVVVPLAYATTRYAWLLGVPLGIRAGDLRELRADGVVWAGAGLATFAVVGAVLTLGLVQRWGEVFPRWVVGLAGRPVPVRLAVVPATYVSLSVVAGGLALVASPQFRELAEETGMGIVLYALWPVWGVALGAATYAYHLRRRGGCGSCGREG